MLCVPASAAVTLHWAQETVDVSMCLRHSLSQGRSQGKKNAQNQLTSLREDAQRQIFKPSKFCVLFFPRCTRVCALQGCLSCDTICAS